jgi:hypothetical protein
MLHGACSLTFHKAFGKQPTLSIVGVQGRHRITFNDAGDVISITPSLPPDFDPAKG